MYSTLSVQTITFSHLWINNLDDERMYLQDVTDQRQDDVLAPVEENETPFNGDEKKRSIIKNKEPIRPPSPQGTVYMKLKTFLNEVVVLLVTINENEIWSAINYMKPPQSAPGKLIPPGSKRAIDFMTQNWNPY